MEQRYLFIVNSRSNPSMLAELDNAIARLTPEERTRLEIRYTQYGGHAGDIAIEASQQHGNKIVVVSCGGDGTVHEISNALAFRPTPMLCLPFGTGNDFIRSTGLERKKKTMYDYITNLDKHVVTPIDLIRIDSYDCMGSHLPMWSCYCNNVSSIGLDTKVQAMAKAKVLSKPKSKMVRKTAYLTSALKLLTGDRSFHFKYQLELENGEMYEGKTDSYTLISICNGKYYGGGFCPAPDASLNDGLADVCVIDDVTLPRALNLILKYKKGKHVGKEGISTFRCTSGIITSTDPSYELEGNYDGEDFFGHRIRFEVFPGALNLATIEL